ncbi:MAG: hypothetical protein ACKO3R_01255 [bacterium]
MTISKYNHITEAVRQKIEAMLLFIPIQKNIARSVGISEGALSLELKRNKHPSGTYSAEYAEAQARKRRKSSKIRTVLTGRVSEYIETHIPHPPNKNPKKLSVSGFKGSWCGM